MEIVVIPIPALYVDDVDRVTASCPDVVVINSGGHDRDQDVARAQLGHIYLFYLEGCHGIAEPIGPEHLSKHPRRRLPNGWQHLQSQ
jgi:hypothetical protein